MPIEATTTQILAAQVVALTRRLAEVSARLGRLEDQVAQLAEHRGQTDNVKRALVALQRQVAAMGSNIEVLRDTTDRGAFFDQPSPL